MKQPKRVQPTMMGKILAAVTLLGAASLANAATTQAINGTMSIYGAYSTNNGTGLADTTSIDLVDVFGKDDNGNGGDLSNVSFFSTGSSSAPLDFPGVAISNLFTIEGWQVDVSSSSIVQQDGTVLDLIGTGTISCIDPTGALCGGITNFASTPVTWQLSAQTTGSTYSMSVATVIPVPAAVWLFGTGLLALASVARKRNA